MKKYLIVLHLFMSLLSSGYSQDDVAAITSEMFQSHQRISLAPMDGWIFHQGHKPAWASPDYDASDWQSFNPAQISTKLQDATGRIEGWFRIKLRLDDSFKNIPLAISRDLWAATDFYLDGKLIHSFGDTGSPYKAYNPILKYPVPIDLKVGKEHLLAIHFVDYESTFTQREIRLKPINLKNFINLTGPDYNTWVTRNIKLTHIYITLCLAVSFLLCFLYWFLVYLNPEQKIFRIIASYTSVAFIGTIVIFGNNFHEISYQLEKIRFLGMITFQAIITLFGLFILEWVLTRKISKMSWILLITLLITNIPAHIFSISPPFAIAFIIMLIHFGRKLYTHRSVIKGANWVIVLAVIVPTVAIIVQIILHKYSLDLYAEYDKPLLSLQILCPPLFYLAYISVRFKETLTAVKVESNKLLQVTEEKREILANQNIILEKQVEERTIELKQSLEHLKSTQAQLIQSEKMASLGELTAGIAHEIQNPLNFVNNFSELNKELVQEAVEELDNGAIEDAKLILKDIGENSNKINHHGKRADAIVKGMLQHSRSSTGQKESTDINVLCDEYLRLAYHGFKAKDKTFNSNFETDFDPTLSKILVDPQDIGRVVLNIINNAFYAVSEKWKVESKNPGQKNYHPKVTVSTKSQGDKIEICISDNGNGIPNHIKDKIFQPFFTTKPTGQGTGLGLSLSYDIIKSLGGEISVFSKIDKGTTFKVIL